MDMSECTHGSIASHCPYCRIAELEKQEIGYIQSLRELEAENIKLEATIAEQRKAMAFYESRLTNATTNFTKLQAGNKELREAAQVVVLNAEWDGDISYVYTDDLQALRAALEVEK